MKGGGLTFYGYVLSLGGGPFKEKKQNRPTILSAVSNDGLKTLKQNLIAPISHEQIKLAIGYIIQDINSSTHLPKSAYKNGIRLDTEHRCQNQKCNPSGKRRLLFMSAGLIDQAIQIKCYGCGLLNTFWNNRIDFDESGALYMKKNNV